MVLTGGEVTASVTEPSIVTLDDIRHAAEVLAPVAVRTPLLPDDVLGDRLAIQLWHKADISRCPLLIALGGEADIPKRD